MKASLQGVPKPRAASASLLSGGDQGRSAARRRAGQIFKIVTLVPVLLAIGLILVLLGDVLTDAVSWQIVEPANSGATFAWSAAPSGGEAVVRLELAAQGQSEAEIQAFLNDPEQLRKFHARNRVELMWWTPQGPWRWVVTNSRDARVADYGLFAGLEQRKALEQGLEAGQNLYLNPWLDFSFFAKNASRTPVVAGIRTALAGSLFVILLVIAISLPLGVGAAVYLEEYASENFFTRLVEVNIRNLAGIPSIVYGIMGLYVFVRLWNFGPSVLAAAFTLALLTLPVVIISSRESIKSVPDSLRQASYGLGATKWQTVAQVVLPNAVTGIVTGIILSIARAIGETAPLLLVGAAAFVPFMPNGLLSKYTVMPIQIYAWVSENDPEFYHVASAAILVLLVVLFALYGLAFYIRRRFERTW